MDEERHGEIVTIWVKRAHRGPMDVVDEGHLIAGSGLEGSADRGGRRQLTIIDEQAWRDATSELGVDVPPDRRRANVMLRGIDLENSRGRLLRLGDCTVRIYGETRPCERMDEAALGLRQALSPHWRAGACAEIVDGGTIHTGDRVEWMSLSS